MTHLNPYLLRALPNEDIFFYTKRVDNSRLVREADESGKLIAASCHAGSVLVSARVLAGRTVTGFRAIRDDLINAGATYVDREVVRDGNLITSRNPEDLPAFCRELVAILRDRRDAPLMAHAGRR